MEHRKTDILISGGGVAGLAAATAFGNAGFDVICVDPAPPVTERDAAGSDLRTTAFLQPARDFLDRVGLWERFAPHATALQVMRIVDAGGPVGHARLVRDFDAADISERPFGWNLPNWLLRREMLPALAGLPNVDFRSGVATTSLLQRESAALVRLSDGETVSARLVIAADGRGSPMREAAGIGVKTTRYGQKALSFAVTHDAPHENVSTEIHRTGGPFTLVPLPDHEGRPCSAVVWMETGPEARRLMELPEATFEEEATLRSCHLYGALSLATRRSAWPIVSQIAERFAGQRLALVAEAAHAVPPIGAQGLNMSLGDIAALLDLAQASPDSLGARAMLEAYDRTRHRQVRARVAGIDLLNRMSISGPRGLRDLRSLGLAALHGATPVRRGLMKLGLGPLG